jgi:hypothetical protein
VLKEPKARRVFRGFRVRRVLRVPKEQQGLRDHRELQAPRVQ